MKLISQWVSVVVININSDSGLDLLRSTSASNVRLADSANGRLPDVCFRHLLYDGGVFNGFMCEFHLVVP